MSKPKLVAAVHPFDAQRAKNIGYLTMQVGWEMADGVLYRPGDPSPCDIICCRVYGQYLPQTAKSLSRECLNQGSSGIFLDIDGELPNDIEAEHFGKTPLSFFSTADLPFSTPVHPIIFGEGWLNSIPSGAAVFISRICRQTRIPKIGTPISRTLSEESLRESISRFKPKICRSKALCADYFYASDGEDTIFTVFESRESLQDKLSLLYSRGVEYCFFKFGELGELLT
ncbi:MAG: hypothetical protein IKM04_07515 [Clostridia bacterium]|nr:hypothetical protein [Clostridia bacterium]